MRKLVVLLIGAAACSGGGSKHNGQDGSVQNDAPDQQLDAPKQQDAQVQPDAMVGNDGGGGGSDGGGATDGGSSANCLVADMLGTITPITPSASADDATAPTMESYDAALNNDALPDVLTLQLYVNYGVYANDATIVPKSNVSLSGEESGFDTCGACLLVFGDLDQNNGPTSIYMPTAGTLNITSTTGNLTGTITGATLVHVDIDPSSLATTPNADGCTTSIDSLTFDEPISTMFAPGPVRVRLHKKHR